MSGISSFDIGAILAIIFFVFLFFMIIRAFLWWYWGIYEAFDRMDETNRLLTEIRDILKGKPTGDTPQRKNFPKE